VSALAEQTPGVLLLTATPEQLGRAGHFGRLSLLDPHRWSDYQDFLEEEANYEPVARLASRLLGGEPLTAEDEGLRSDLPDELGSLSDGQLIEALLDRHGTGRVLFRNTRAAIHGFPHRELIPQPLPLPDGYSGLEGDAEDLIAPERLFGDGWTDIDPRVGWLAGTLRALRPAKVVLICAHAETVLDLRRVLMEREGIHAAVFHEGMAIVERDRAAAYFADPEEGTQILLCSEIGSEGRNFQFAHHLILFDLPLDPDLLEQRIGRLDRIGQTEIIRIHVPYLEATPGETLYLWYKEGLDAFSAVCPAAPAVYQSLREPLLTAFSDLAARSALLDRVRREREQVARELAAGRDRLLELHSHRPQASARLVEEIERQDASRELGDYMTRLWDSFGVEHEPGPGAALVLQPGTHMLHEQFPGLPEDGLTVTFDRSVALAHEDREFLTWEHPMVRNAMEMITSSDLGSCALTILRDPGLPAGTLLLEMLQVARCPAPPELEIGRYLPPTALRLLLDERGKDLARDVPHDRLRGQCLTRNRKLARAVIKSKESALERMIEHGEALASESAAGLEAKARERMKSELDAEIERMRALARVNPSVRPDEIEYLEGRRELLTHHLSRVRLHLDALRVIMTA
jgi:ATP-dependent helicase HepA